MTALANVPALPVTATGALTDWLSASDAITGYAGAQLTATAFTGTVQCQGSFDGGTTSVALQLVNLADGTTGTGITAAGCYRADVGTVPRFRWYCSAFTGATSAYLYTTIREG